MILLESSQLPWLQFLVGRRAKFSLTFITRHSDTLVGGSEESVSTTRGQRFDCVNTVIRLHHSVRMHCHRRSWSRDLRLWFLSREPVFLPDLFTMIIYVAVVCCFWASTATGLLAGRFYSSWCASGFCCWSLLDVDKVVCCPLTLNTA